MKLLYRTAEWHALAKLRMHSDSTLTLLEDLTIEFGKLMRQFRDLTCSQFQTVELPRETAARYRRQTKQQVSATQDTSSYIPAINVASLLPPITSETSASSHSRPQPSAGPGPKTKRLNLFTIKFHFLGDYVRHIRLFGTTDSFSTQLVCNFSKFTRLIYHYSNQGELAHRLVKRLYGLTNKKNAVQQISKKYSRQQSFQRRPEEQEEKEANEGVGRLSDHHIISCSRNERLDLFSFSRANGDPAKKVR